MFVKTFKLTNYASSNIASNLFEITLLENFYLKTFNLSHKLLVTFILIFLLVS